MMEDRRSTQLGLLVAFLVPLPPGAHDALYVALPDAFDTVGGPPLVMPGRRNLEYSVQPPRTKLGCTRCAWV